MCARVFRILYRTIENPEQKETKKIKREKKKEKENARHEQILRKFGRATNSNTKILPRRESKVASLRRRRQQQH